MSLQDVCSNISCDKTNRAAFLEKKCGCMTTKQAMITAFVMALFATFTILCICTGSGITAPIVFSACALFTLLISLVATRVCGDKGKTKLRVEEREGNMEIPEALRKEMSEVIRLYQEGETFENFINSLPEKSLEKLPKLVKEALFVEILQDQKKEKIAVSVFLHISSELDSRILNKRLSSGYAPLQHSLKLGFSDLSCLLMQNPSVDVLLKSDDEITTTPLHQVANAGIYRELYILLGRKEFRKADNINAINKRDETPLEQLIMRYGRNTLAGEFLLKMIRILVDAGASTDFDASFSSLYCRNAEIQSATKKGN